MIGQADAPGTKVRRWRPDQRENLPALEKADTRIPSSHCDAAMTTRSTCLAQVLVVHGSPCRSAMVASFQTTHRPDSAASTMHAKHSRL